jgi:hypothetical protein
MKGKQIVIKNGDKNATHELNMHISALIYSYFPNFKTDQFLYYKNLLYLSIDLNFFQSMFSSFEFLLDERKANLFYK